jgi:hypothetical protein
LRRNVPVPFAIFTAMVSLVVRAMVCDESEHVEPPLPTVHVIDVAAPFFRTVSVTPTEAMLEPTCTEKWSSVPAIGTGDAAASAVVKTFCEPAVPAKPVVSSASTKATAPVTL